MVKLNHLILSNYSFLDIFAIPISMKATRRNHFMGSIPGVMIGAFTLFMISYYIVSQTSDMFNSKLDSYISLSMANSFDPENEEF